MHYKCYKCQNVWDDNVKVSYYDTLGKEDNPIFALCYDCEVELDADKKFKVDLLETLKKIHESIDVLSGKLETIANK